MTYPATNYQEAVELTIEASNEMHDVINGTASQEVTVADGNKIPTLRKSLFDNFYFLDPIDWVNTNFEDKFNQIRKFTDGTFWVAMNATQDNQIQMGSTPYGDPEWTITYTNFVNEQQFYEELGYNFKGDYADNPLLEGRQKGNVLVDVCLYNDVLYYYDSLSDLQVDSSQTPPSNLTPVSKTTAGNVVTVDGETQEEFNTQIDTTVNLLDERTENVADVDVFDLNYANPYRSLSDYVFTGKVYGFSHTGQSLAEGGVGGDNAGSVYTPFSDKALMLNGKPVYSSSEVATGVVNPISEVDRVTIGSSMLNDFTANLDSDEKSIFHGQAWGGQPYSTIKKRWINRCLRVCFNSGTEC